MLVDRKKGRCNGLKSQQDQTSIQRNAPVFIQGIIRCWVPDTSRCRARFTPTAVAANCCQGHMRILASPGNKPPIKHFIALLRLLVLQEDNIESLHWFDGSKNGVRANLLNAPYRSPSVSVSKVYFYNPSSDNWHISLFNSKSLLHHCDCRFSRHQHP